MVIRASSGRQIDQLVADLGSDRAVTRDTAIARLTVFGSRAVNRLVEAAGADRPPATRIAALRALDAIGDPRGLPAARTAALDPTSDPLSATAAIALLRGFLLGAEAVATTDVLTGLALDRARPDQVRVAAVQALAELPAATVEPIWAHLREDPSAAVAAQIPAPGARTPRKIDDEELLAGVLPDTPDMARAALARAGRTAPLAVLQGVVDRVREREGGEDGTRRDQWRRVRGAAHLALAERGSRLALYDLKETLSGADAALPVEFLAALGMVGDASCLEAIAAAHGRATATLGEADWWQEHLVDAFRAIVKRERLTRRHAALKRIARRWPAALAHLLARPTRPT